jgi:hypothetical protein
MILSHKRFLSSLNNHRQSAFRAFLLPGADSQSSIAIQGASFQDVETHKSQNDINDKNYHVRINTLGSTVLNGKTIFATKDTTLAPHAHLSRAQVPGSAGEITKKKR